MFPDAAAVSIELVIAVAVAAAFGLYVRGGIGSGADVEVRYVPGQPPRARGKAAQARLARVRSAVADINLDRGFSALAWKNKNQPWRVQVRGNLSSFQRQRVRNVMLEALG